jgi:hypothetical protein
MSFINSVISFFSIVERNIFYFFFNIVLQGKSSIFNINNINGINNSNSINVNKFMKDKNSNEDLLNGQRKTLAPISPITSNNDLTIEIRDTDLYDCLV